MMSGTKWPGALVVIIAALSIATPYLDAAARNHRIEIWDILVDKSGAFASDCQRCEEDRGIDIECKNGSSRATISFNWLEPQKGRSGNGIDVVIFIDGEKFRRSGILSEPGLIGAFPVVDVDLNDPLLGAIGAGTKLTANADDQTMSVPLKGSSKALSRLIKACR